MIVGESDDLSVGDPAPEQPKPTVIRATQGWLGIDLRELWSYRELIFFLGWRDISVRYKQTVLGILWAVLQPLMLMIVFSVVFGGLAKIPSEGVPYPVFVYAGLLPWQLFAFALGQASLSIAGSERLITKIYFPRLIIPIAAVGVGLVDFAVSLVLLFALMLLFGIPLMITLVALPLFVVLALIGAMGVGLWLAALNVHYRDVRYTLPFLTQLWLLASPVIYPSSLLPEPWRTLIGLNPMSGVIEGFRWATIGAAAPPVAQLFISTLTASMLLVTGALYFRRMERTFADVI